MKHYISSYVRCPFYHSEEAQKIHCEGVGKDGSSLHNVFSDKKELKEYREKYCCKDYNSCSIARMLSQKYR